MKGCGPLGVASTISGGMKAFGGPTRIDSSRRWFSPGAWIHWCGSALGWKLHPRKAAPLAEGAPPSNLRQPAVSGVACEISPGWDMAMGDEKEHNPWQQVIVIVASGLALYAAFGHPREYSVYILTRWAVTIAAITNAACLIEKQSTARTAQVVLALVFNPIIPLHAGRDTWVLLDCVAPLVLFWGKRTTE